MNVIASINTPVKKAPSTESQHHREDISDAYAWSTMYSGRPSLKLTLYEMERLVAKRMDLLAFVDQQLNSPHVKSLDDVLKLIKNRIVRERRFLQGTTPSKGHASPYDDDDEEFGIGAVKVAAPAGSLSAADDQYSMTKEEDLISHLLCRFAFCMDDKWRRWYLRTEETLLRARIATVGDQNSIAQRMLVLNKVACRPLTAEEGNSPMVVAYMNWISAKMGHAQAPNPHKFLAVPMSLVPKLIKDRKVIVVKGTAIISEEHALDLALTIFKRNVNAGLFESYVKRSKLQENVDPLVWGMLDAFLSRYVADQADNLKESKEGSVKAGDVQFEANTHMPLCMRRIDNHLRSHNHVKHTGRLTYGLFLKQIGLSMDDAMLLFSTLMSVKGGGSKEVFEKSAYGYNIRHNYGKEGRKTSYSSMGCSTIVGQPPLVDSNDCHGCPYKFRDEGALRKLLQTEQINPQSRELPKVRPTNGDIEDIIKDAREMHYTRACYKYFMATHPAARRDTLFRSPYEYYTISKEVKKEFEATKAGAEGGAVKKEGGDGSPTVGSKRPSGVAYVPERENATKYRPE